MYIYKITNLINNKIYIGQTVRNIKIRFNEHCKDKRMLIGKAIRKHGKENFKVEVINEFDTIDELNYFEEYYISLFNSLAPHGYNLNTGGLSRLMHQSTKDKLSKLKMGMKISLNIKTKNSTSRFHGVRKSNSSFQSCFTSNKITNVLTSSKSEKWCAYIYDQYCIENNLIERKLNNISYEEAYNDYLQYYDQNGFLKSKRSKHKYIYYNKRDKAFFSQIIFEHRSYHIGYFETEIEAVKAVNKFILDNNIDKPLLIIQ